MAPTQTSPLEDGGQMGPMRGENARSVASQHTRLGEQPGECPAGMKVCMLAGCPALVKTGYCPKHKRELDRARGNRHLRGYGNSHTNLRNDWAQIVAKGTVRCSRCSDYIGAGQPWHLDHDDSDRTKYRGPSHVRCNLAAGGKASHQRL